MGLGGERGGGLGLRIVLSGQNVAPVVEGEGALCRR